MSEYRIYVASLSDYNAGRLHGVWIDCDGKDADELQVEVNAMLRESGYPNVSVECLDCAEGYLPMPCDGCAGSGVVPSAEEYAIYDHEGFGDLIDEYTSLKDVADIVGALETVDNADALKEFAEAFGYHITEAAYNFDNAFHGYWRSKRAFAEEYIDSDGLLTGVGYLAAYFDYDAFARDLFMDYTMTESGYVFCCDH